MSMERPAEGAEHGKTVSSRPAVPTDAYVASPTLGAASTARLFTLPGLGRFRAHEFHEALLDARAFDDLPGKWQAAILKAEQNRPQLRLVTRD
jgi:hypothetical protein